jgi:hypothetical protein
LAKILPPNRRKVGLDLSRDLPLIWYENEDGDVWVPDLNGNEPPPPPPDFVYQYSRFPRTLTENVLRIITQEDIDTCAHEEVVIDHGLIEGLEGRICRSCGGSQTKKVGEPWPAVWAGAGSSRNVATMNSGFSEDLVLAMTRPTDVEIAKAAGRGHRITPVSFERAVILAATSCERCLNVLLYRHGLDDGYEEGSPEWEAANTRCQFCE